MVRKYGELHINSIVNLSDLRYLSEPIFKDIKDQALRCKILSQSIPLYLKLDTTSVGYYSFSLCCGSVRLIRVSPSMRYNSQSEDNLSKLKALLTFSYQTLINIFNGGVTVVLLNPEVLCLPTNPIGVSSPKLIWELCKYDQMEAFSIIREFLQLFKPTIYVEDLTTLCLSCNASSEEQNALITYCKERMSLK